MIVYAVKEPDICPYCHRGKFLRAPREESQQTMTQTVIIQQGQSEEKPDAKYCSNCGAQITTDTNYCTLCGNELK